MQMMFNWPIRETNPPCRRALHGYLHLFGNRIYLVEILEAFILAFALLSPSQSSAQVVTVNQSFTGATAPGWTLGDNGGGFTPVLTASNAGGNIDTVGNGWLRLTNAAGNEATYAVDPTAFNGANATIAAKFTFASWNGSGADGITFFLADASKTFGVGAYGGSLGYAQKTAAGGGGADINGMSGGYVGVGIDEYGNYSNPTEGRIGGIGPVPNAIAVRGPGQGLTGYNYLGGTGNLGTNSIAFPTYTTRPTGADTRTIEIILTATNQMTVYLQSGTTGQFVPLYSIDLSGYARPDQLILGFTGSTGGSTDIHEIQNVSLSSVAANLWTNTGADSKWATGNDWYGSSVPATGADILLDNTYVSAAQTIDVGAGQDRVIRSLQIDAPFSYTLNNGTLEFNNNGILGPSGILVSQTHGSATQTINSNLIADNAIEIKNGSAGALNLTGTLAAGSNTVTFDGTGNTAMSGAISGTGASLVKNDAGTLTLSGANTYAGGTTLNTGTLTANNNSALGTGGLTINDGTLASTNSSAVNNSITLNGNAGLNGITTSGALTQTGGSYTLNMANATQSGGVNISNNATAQTLTVQVNSGTSTISGVIANGGTSTGDNLTKIGAGTLNLSGANTYTGTTAINAGTVQLGKSNVLSNSSSLNIAGGTLNLNGNSELVGNLSFSNGGTIDFGSGSTANTLIFGNVSSYSGVLTITDWASASDNLASTNSSLGAVLNNIYFSGYGSGSVQPGTTATYDGATGYVITPNTSFLTWNGSGTDSYWSTGADWVNGTAPVTTVGSTQKIDFTGTTRLGPVMNNNYSVNALKFDSGAGAFTISGPHTLTLNGTLPSIIQQSANAETISVTTIAVSANSVVDVSGSGGLTISSALSGTGSLTKLSAGTLALSGNNSGCSGAIGVNAGILSVSTSNSVLGTGATTVQSGGTLRITDGRTLANAITLNGAGAGGIGALDAIPGAANTATISGGITLGSDSTITAGSGTLSLSGGITGTNTNLTLADTGTINVSSAIATGTGGVTLTGTGTTTFSGTTANTYTGATTVNSGTLTLSKTANVNAIAGNLTINGGTVNETATGQIASTATVALNSGAFNLGANATQTVAELDSSSGSTVTLNNTGSILTINEAGNGVISGTIAGAGSLVTSGTGSVTLANANTYTGGTTIGSVVTALNSGSLGTGAATINSGGNLQIQGGITLANPFTLNSTGTSANDGAVQNVSGNNTLSGAVTLTGSSRLQSDSGLLNLSNTVALGANTLNVGGDGNTAISYAISGTGTLTKDGAGTLTLSGTAANTYSGATTVNAGTLALNKTAGTNAIAGSLTISGGAVQLLQSNQIANASAVTIGSGTLNLNGNSDQVGNLSFSSGAVIDFGSATSGNTLLFGNVPSYSGQLAINDWGTADTLATTNNALASALLNSIYFSSYGSATEPGTTISYGGTTGYLLTPGTFLNWNGGGTDNNWSTGANWALGTAPVTTAGSAQKLDFTGTARLGPVMNNSYSVNVLKFDSGAGVFNINENGNTLTLSGTLPSIIQQSSSAETISGGTVALGVASVIDVSGSGGLTISSALSGSGSLTKLSAGTLALSGNNSGYSGAIGVNAGILSVSGNNNVLGTGATTVQNGGTLQITDGRSLGNAITLNGAGAGGIGALDAIPGAGNTATISGAITLGSESTIAAGSGTLSLSGGITGTNANLTLTSAGAINVSSAIATGTGGVTLNGTGTTTFSGAAANTYTGATTVNSGTLLLNKTAGTNAIAGNLTVSGGTVKLQAGNQIADTSTVAISSGTLDLNGYAETVGALNLTGGTLALSDSTSANTGSLVSSSVGPLSVTSGSIIDFGNNTGGERLIASSVSASSVLTVENWTAGVDYFCSTALPTGLANIDFVGYFPGATATWDSTDGFYVITPVPEPAAYGAVFMALGLLTCLVAARRRRADVREP